MIDSRGWTSQIVVDHDEPRKLIGASEATVEYGKAGRCLDEQEER
jgi:hypothetical protein